MAATFLTAVLSFVSTNIDDIFVLMVLYTQATDSKAILQVIIGQYLGIGALSVLGIFGALGTQIFPPQYIGLLGFLPLFLGVRTWMSHQHNPEDQGQETQIGFFSVFLLTIANGADNIGVYIPVFSGYTLLDIFITLVIFAGMTGLWCYLGLALANYPYIKKNISRYQHILVPLVLMGLGLYILIKNYI